MTSLTLGNSLTIDSDSSHRPKGNDLPSHKHPQSFPEEALCTSVAAMGG